MCCPKFKDDYNIARQICARLRSGDHDSILTIYSKYHLLFKVFVRKRLFTTDPARAEITLDNFWLELLNAMAICSYQGKTSLKAYLLTGSLPCKPRLLRRG